MTLRTLGIAVLGVLGLVTLSACPKEEGARDKPAVASSPEQPQAATKPETAAVEPAPAPLTGGGSVQGTVTFKGTPPPAAALAPSLDPACQGMPLVDPSLRVKGGKVENVLVRVRGLVPGSRPSQPAVIDQNQCNYVPRVQGVTAGQSILIKNSDGTLHNARALTGSKSIFNVAQPPGAKPVQRTLPADAEVVHLKCDIHPWMSAWIVVNPNPFFATTNAEGAFSIEHLPPGTYTLEAWHETLGTRTAEVSIEEGQNTSVSFEFALGDTKGTAAGGEK